jgi:hypothetical protein
MNDHTYKDQLIIDHHLVFSLKLKGNVKNKFATI